MAINDPIGKLIEFHDHIMARLSVFSRSLQAIEKHGPVGFVSEKENVRMLFDFIDASISTHTREEEEGLFPKLRPKLKTKSPRLSAGDTSVDVMEGEHRMITQAAARMKQLATLIEKDIRSADVSTLLKEYVDKGWWLIQASQQHIWKENNVLFPLAEQSLTVEEKKEVAILMNEL